MSIEKRYVSLSFLTYHESSLRKKDDLSLDKENVGRIADEIRDIIGGEVKK